MDIGQRHVGAVYPAGLFAALNFAQTQDIDEQAAFLKGWNQTYAQTSSGRFRGSIFEVQLDESISSRKKRAVRCISSAHFPTTSMPSACR